MDWAGEGENVEAKSVTEKKTQLFFWVDQTRDPAHRNKSNNTEQPTNPTFLFCQLKTYKNSLN